MPKIRHKNYIEIWSKEAENLFDQLMRDNIAFTTNRKLTQRMGKTCHDFVGKDKFLGIVPWDKEGLGVVFRLPGTKIDKINGFKRSFIKFDKILRL